MILPPPYLKPLCGHRQYDQNRLFNLLGFYFQFINSTYFRSCIDRTQPFNLELNSTTGYA